MLTYDVSVAYRPSSRVNHIDLSKNGINLAWAQSDSKVCKLSNFSNYHEIIIDSSITGLKFKTNYLFILDEAFGLRKYSNDSNISWEVQIPSGGSMLSLCNEFIAVVDNLGRLNIVNYHGALQHVSDLFSSIIRLESIDNNLVVVQEDGTIHLFDGKKIIWTRPKRGDVGESVTSVGLSSNGNLIIGREGYALVPGEEEALEMEVWDLTDKVLISRMVLRNRLLKIACNHSRTVLGFDDGSVIELIDLNKTIDEQLELINCKYPIKDLLLTETNNLIAGAWFYIHGLNQNGQKWMIEHQGIVQMIVFSESKELVYFAGDDQNDYTENEPIGYFDLKSKLLESDKSELTSWFENNLIKAPLSAEEIYSVDEKMNSFLNQEYSNQEINSGISENLIGALEAEIDSNIDSNNYEKSLLQDNSSNDDSLLQQLRGEIIPNKSPIADAGEDMIYHTGSDKSTIILLDSSKSFDPNNMVVKWSWTDQSGREISTSSKCRVKLSKGKYRFELRLIDSNGNSTSDSVLVEVI